jgi:hypothetical protein
MAQGGQKALIFHYLQANSTQQREQFDILINRKYLWFRLLRLAVFVTLHHNYSLILLYSVIIDASKSNDWN